MNIDMNIDMNIELMNIDPIIQVNMLYLHYYLKAHMRNCI